MSSHSAAKLRRKSSHLQSGVLVSFAMHLLFLLLITFLFLSFALPQVWLGSKYAGRLGSLAVLVFCAAGFIFAGIIYQRSSYKWTGSKYVAIAFLAMSSLLLYVIYPLANARNEIGRGSDSDEAIQIATRRLLSGLPPYDAVTFLDNPITPLPGALILYAPAQALLGHTVWMAPILLGLTFFLLSKADKGSLGPLIVVLGVSPLFWHSWVTGGDYIILGLLAFALAAFIVSTPRTSVIIVPTVLLGIASTSRPTMLLVITAVVLLEFAFGRTRRALLILTVTLSVAAIVVIPVYLWDPITFSPFHVTTKAGGTWSGVAAVVLSLVWQLCIFVIFLRYPGESRWPARNLALILGPAGLLMAIPPTLFFGDSIMLYYASFTTMLCPLAIPLALRLNRKAVRRLDSEHLGC